MVLNLWTMVMMMILEQCHAQTKPADWTMFTTGLEILDKLEKSGNGKRVIEV